MTTPAFVIVVPNSMASRALVESKTFSKLKKEGKENIVVIGGDEAFRNRLPEYVEWRSLEQPCLLPPRQSKIKRFLRGISVRLSQIGLDYGNLSYRFNHIHGFNAHRFKQGLNKERQQREIVAGNYVAKKFGWPFPGSRLLYRFIYWFYYAPWQIPDRKVAQLFDEMPIDTVVMWYVQNVVYRDYSLCIRKHRVRAVGVLGSWDRPTTKGPICPGCERYVVNSEVMKNELAVFHGIARQDIDVVGWPLMDIYKDTESLMTRKDFFESINANPDLKLLVFAGNSARLGAHEPGIVAFIEKRMNEGAYGENTNLLVRAHPNDNGWEARFSELIGKPNVIVMPGGMGNSKLLANTLFHSDVVIATQGSVSLDAAAFDKCIINISFDGYLNKAHCDSVARWYEMDHYVPVVESGGVAVVKSFEELDESINAYLKDPGKDGQNRETLRRLELAPFEGDASYRQARAIIGNPIQ